MRLTDIITNAGGTKSSNWLYVKPNMSAIMRGCIDQQQRVLKKSLRQHNMANPMSADLCNSGMNRPLFAEAPEVWILGYGKEQMRKQILTMVRERAEPMVFKH